MENNSLLDVCVCISRILTYFYTKGVISINGDPWTNTGKIHLDEEVFKEIFPDAVPDEDGFAFAEYDGVKVVSIIKEAIKR